VWLCNEHVPNDWLNLEHQIRAAKLFDMDTIVRVSKGSYSEYIKPFECDATGIMVPHIASADRRTREAMAQASELKAVESKEFQDREIEQKPHVTRVDAISKRQGEVQVQVVGELDAGAGLARSALGPQASGKDLLGDDMQVFQLL